MQAGPERDYFAGVLANRTGHLEDSIHHLNDALPNIRVSEPARAAIALEALADDYNKSFRYDDAVRTYDDLLAHFTAQLDPHRLHGTKDDSGVMHLLRGVPVQTITWQAPVRLKTERDAIGSLVTELEVNGVRGQWLLDTGANFSVVTRGFARRLGLKPLPGFGQTTAGVTGIENPLQVAVLPLLQMGGATLRNVVVLILDDASLKVGLGKQTYQINAIIGYPVFQALGAITFLREGVIEAGDATRQNSAGTRMYMKLLTPVIECGVEGKELPFSFDTGASGSSLSVRYYNRFRAEADSWNKRENRSGGAGGIVRRKIYLQPKLDLTVGGATATLENVSIFPMNMGSDLDELYGNLGLDLVARFESFTLDFSRMTFSLGPPLAAAADMSVFENASQLASWAGVCPGNNESAGKRRNSRIPKGNVYLKTALVEAANAPAKAKGTYLRDKFYRLKARRGYERAAVAVAHNKHHLTRNLVHRLERLGYTVTPHPSAL